MADAQRLCIECGFPEWRGGADLEGKCLRWHWEAHHEAPIKFVMQCRDRTITRLRAELLAASAKTEGQCCATAVAAREGVIAELRVQVDRLTSNAKRAVKVLLG